MCLSHPSPASASELTRWERIGRSSLGVLIITALASTALPCGNGKATDRPSRIVVGDSDPAMSQFYQTLLPRLGHQVWVAGTGLQLVDHCRLLCPGLVITDVQLPVLDGLAAARDICRAQPTPILVVAGRHDPELVGRALDNPHILAYLVKPIKEADLRPAITLARRHFDKLQSLYQQVTFQRQALVDRQLIERAKGMLMKYVRLGEEEAYRRLQQMARVRNLKLAEVAQEIVLAGEVFQDIAQAPPAGGKPNRTNGLR